MRDASEWPDLTNLVFPRDPEGRSPDPVLEALAEFATPWHLATLAHALRDGGIPIPTRAEAEYAAAAHFLVGHALRAGADWRRSAMDALKALPPKATEERPHG